MHLLTVSPNTTTKPQPTQTDDDINPSPPTSLHPDVQNLLKSFPTIFQPPHGLPTARPHDHKIPFLPNTAPINVKPYRYPHSQKEAMTSIIHDMLKEGTIVPSNNPYSSPVLLVQKKRWWLAFLR